MEKKFPVNSQSSKLYIAKNKITKLKMEPKYIKYDTKYCIRKAQAESNFKEK